MTRSERQARYEQQRRSAEDKQFVKQFHRIRMSLFHLREGGMLHEFLDSKEQITQKVNERMFAEDDDKLLGRTMNLPQFIRYANDQEALVAECIWKARQRGGVRSEDEIAKSCSQPPVWTFKRDWVKKQVEWHESRIRVESAASAASEHNKVNKLMAIAWGIANN